MSLLASAVRSLRARPGVTLMAILLLAIGVGVNLALFTVVRAVVLEPLPWPDAERLVHVWERGPGDFGESVGVSVPDFLDWRERFPALDLAAWGSRGLNLSEGESALYLEAHVVSSGYFETLGTAPLLGRGFIPEEEREGRGGTAIISHALWHSRFGGSESIIGRSILLSGQQKIIVGVLPAGFRPPEPAEVFLPLAEYGGNARIWRTTHPLRVIGRIPAGATVSAVERDLDGVARGIWSAENAAGWNGWGLRLEPVASRLVGDLDLALRSLWIAVILVLAIAAVNVASLLLSRSIERRMGDAVRIAIGASRRRIIGEALTEALLLAAAGSVAGAAAAAASIRWIRAMLPESLAHIARVQLDWGAFGYGAAIAAVAASCAAAIPALRLLSLDPARELGSGSRESGRGGSRGAIIMLEVALTTPLLVGSVLMLLTMREIARIDHGADARGVLTFRTLLPAASYPDSDARSAFLSRALEALESLPSVQSAGVISNAPFSIAGTNSATSVFVEGRPMEDASQRAAADVRAVSPGALESLGVRLLRGRMFNASDLASARVALLNETAARHMFGDADALGTRIIDGNEPDHAPELWYRVVGVVSDVRSGGVLEPPVPEIYIPFTRRASPTMTFVVRTEGDPELAIGAARQVIARLDPGQPLFEVASLEERIEAGAAAPRLARSLFGILAAIALTLAATGCYGVLACEVRRRRRELAIRAALGATAVDAIAGLLGRAARLSVAGLAIGLLAAVLGARMLGTVAYGVNALDPRAFAAAAALVALAIALSAIAPAIAAARAAPAAILRKE